MDGDTFKEMKYLIDGPALLGGIKLSGNRRGRSVADVTSAAAAVDARKEAQADKDNSGKDRRLLRSDTYCGLGGVVLLAWLGQCVGAVGRC